MGNELDCRYTQVLAFVHDDGWCYRVTIDGEQVFLEYIEFGVRKDELTVPLSFAKEMFPQICDTVENQAGAE